MLENINWAGRQKENESHISPEDTSDTEKVKLVVFLLYFSKLKPRLEIGKGISIPMFRSVWGGSTLAWLWQCEYAKRRGDRYHLLLGDRCNSFMTFGELGCINFASLAKEQTSLGGVFWNDPKQSGDGHHISGGQLIGGCKNKTFNAYSYAHDATVRKDAARQSLEHSTFKSTICIYGIFSAVVTIFFMSL